MSKVKVRTDDGSIVDCDVSSLPVVTPIDDSELDLLERQLLAIWGRLQIGRTRYVTRPKELKTGYSAQVVVDVPDGNFMPAVFHARIDMRSSRVRMTKKFTCQISGS